MFAISPTDLDWFNYLRRNNLGNKINFWTPTPWNIKGLNEGDRFYFMLKAPIRKIGGYGLFKRYSNLAVKDAWEKYGDSNGCETEDELLGRLYKYTDKHTNSPVSSEEVIIGCIELVDCEFWSESDFIIPEDYGISFPKEIVKIKYFKQLNPFNSASYLKPIRRAHSWSQYSKDDITKILDKSAFEYNGSGIPKEIRDFFNSEDLLPGERKHLELVHEGKIFPSHIEKENNDHGRTRLFWDTGLTQVLREKFPEHYCSFQNNSPTTTQALMNLKRSPSLNKYEVFLCQKSQTIEIASIAEDIESEKAEEYGIRHEGKVQSYFGKRYERNPKNRRDAIRIHGLNCMACGFNFEKFYGERGANYIEIHHSQPIHTLKEEQQINPKTDLIPLCSNCHRIVHRKKDDVLSLEELKALIIEDEDNKL